jgi:hypothetical protein
VKRFSHRFIARLIQFLVFSFVVFISVAFYFYPGGNHFDPLVQGHSFWLNFWCDIMTVNAVNNAPNTARPWAILGALFLIGALGTMGASASLLMNISKRYYRLMLILGGVSILGGIAMEYNHDLFLNITAISGLLACSIFLYHSLKSGHITFIFLGCLTYLTTILNLILWLNDHPTSFLPIIQKLSTVFLLMWLISGSLLLIKKEAT